MVDGPHGHQSAPGANSSRNQSTVVPLLVARVFPHVRRCGECQKMAMSTLITFFPVLDKSRIAEKCPNQDCPATYCFEGFTPVFALSGTPVAHIGWTLMATKLSTSGCFQLNFKWVLNIAHFCPNLSSWETGKKAKEILQITDLIGKQPINEVGESQKTIYLAQLKWNSRPSSNL